MYLLYKDRATRVRQTAKITRKFVTHTIASRFRASLACTALLLACCKLGSDWTALFLLYSFIILPYFLCLFSLLLSIIYFFVIYLIYFFLTYHFLTILYYFLYLSFYIIVLFITYYND